MKEVEPKKKKLRTLDDERCESVTQELELRKKALPCDDESKLVTKINYENKIDEKWEDIRQKSNLLKQSRELNMTVFGWEGSEKQLNGFAKVNDSQRVKKRPEKELPQGEKQTVEYRMKQNVSKEHQSRSAEIQQLSLTTPAVGSQLAAANKMKKTKKHLLRTEKSKQWI